MHKVLTVLVAEVRAFLQTKAFIVSMLILPLCGFVTPLLNDKLHKVDTTPRSFAVIDRGSSLYGAIERAAKERDRAIAAGKAQGSNAPFVPVLEPVGEGDAALTEARLRLSDRVRRGQLFAFVEIPPDIVDVTAKGPSKLAYVSATPTYGLLREWLEQTLVREVRARRYAALGVGPDAIAQLERPLRAEDVALWEASPTGAPARAATVDRARMVIAPLAALILLFSLVLLTTTSMLNAVIEEKASRISEVLLGSVSPFELMLGKLLGGTAVSLLLGALYVGCGIWLAQRSGLGGIVTPSILASFTLFLVLALLMFGSIYLAIGAACSDYKQAQTLVMPVMFLGMMPVFFVMPTILEAPSGAVAVGASLFPTTAPFAMLLRLGLQPAPPAWQVVVGIGTTLASALFCVWAAARVFRVGLLMQGKPVTFGELARWISRG